MFELGDRVQVNLGAGGTHKGNVIEPLKIKSIHVQLDNGNAALIDPWDVFHIEEETE